MSLEILGVTGRCHREMCGNSEFHGGNAGVEKQQGSGGKTRGFDVTERQPTGRGRERWKLRKGEGNGRWRAGLLVFFSGE